jgi:spore coat polysaccharide biosynthesis protein SpsF (cytidylyltransferase family)
MRRLVFIYARTDSRRVPSKALMLLAGRKLVDIVIDRAQFVGSEGCVLLTSAREVDDELAAHVEARGMQVVRGHATDLVNRTLQALDETKATHFLRVNGDSPFFAPELARYTMYYLEKADLVSNLLSRRFPYGVAVEWMAAPFYEALAKSALTDELEHVTRHLYRQINTINALSLEQERDDSRLRLVLDTIDDHFKLKKLIQEGDPSKLTYWQLFSLTEPVLSVHSYFVS